jgi:hypothetical protein
MIKTWNIEAMTGYSPITTFYEDFSIADKFGLDAIQDTYNRAMEGWKNNYKYLTELVMALNWKIWEHYEHNEAYAELYDKLYREADEYACENLKGEELSYFFRTTD